MNYVLHPEAAAEHEEQVVYYEGQTAGLGARYHRAFLGAVSRACETPHRFRIVAPPGIQRIALHGFPFYVLFREINDRVQTSEFSREAYDYVSRIDCKIVLIDGVTLAGHMISFGVGVSTVATYDVKKIDHDFFNDG